MNEKVTAMQIHVEPETMTRLSKMEQWAHEITITTAADHERAIVALQGWASMRKGIVEWFRDTKTKAKAAHQAVCDQESSLLKRGDKAREIVQPKILAWEADQEAIRRKEQARLQAIKDAETERERMRLEKAAAKLKTPELREQRLEEAAALVAPAVPVAPVEKVAGASGTSTWKAEVIDMAALPKEWCLPNQKALDAHARSTKGQIHIPGVRFTEVKGLAIR